MLLHERLHDVAGRFADKIALSFAEGTLTFAELDRRSRALAGTLGELGVGRGDRVALLGDSCAALVVAVWATLNAGGTAVYLNEQLAPEALGEVLDDCEPAVVFASRRYADAKLSRMRPGTKLGRVLVLEDEAGLFVAAPGSGGRVVPTTSETDVATIVYTSGSTGRPKGVCLSHRNWSTTVRAVSTHMPITADDSYLMVVPLHYVHGLMQLFVHTLSGATIHFAKDFLFPNVVLDQLVRTRVTGFSGVPYHFAALIDRSTFLQTSLPHLKWITVTGGKMPPERVKQIREAQPELAIHIAYGQTECAPRATALDPRRIDRKPESVGSPIPGVTVLILDDEGREVPRGEVGEVVVAGDNVMAGYWRQPEATARVIDADGRLHTGDLGRFDQEGDLFLAGRRDAMIKSAGERVFAEEIETVLLQCEGVVDAVVVGVPDELAGQRIEAHVRVGPPLPAGDEATQHLADRIRQQCLSKLPFARAPKAYHIWAEFPRKPNGKVDRQRMLQGPGSVLRAAVG
jgi:amino acid adenylation domain-containing protein